MGSPLAAPALALALFVCLGAEPVAACAGPDGALGVSRLVEIDAAAGPIYGEMTRREKEPPFLAADEVVLTFDDGPVPWITVPILDTLDRHCTKATFFSVGEMALAYPKAVREVVARGHTLGTHTWSHPLSLRRLGVEKAIDQIERGFAAVALAAGRPIAPFFRFPGLSDSDELLAHLQTRGIASFTVDVVSNDSYIRSADRLVRYTLKQIDSRKGGILLFHDIKPATARALPAILAGLKARGYKVVHLIPKTPVEPVADYEPELAPELAKAEARRDDKPLVPFYGAVGPPRALNGEELPVTELAPDPRVRTDLTVAADTDGAPAATPSSAKRPRRAISQRPRRSRRTDVDARRG